MEKMNSVYIGVSLDGYIADKNGGLSFLETIPIPEGVDMGYAEFTDRIDAIVMGRVSFETVLGFGIDWPYQKPVFVLSSKLKVVPQELKDKVFPINGSLSEVLEEIHNKGYNKLYIDGGTTIQSFLKEGLIDEMIITTIPILVGGGSTLFGELDAPMQFELVKSEVFAEHIVQNHYKRKR